MLNTLEKLGLVRTINDPIHGTIQLNDMEMLIIEHPLFQRLHNLKQNSFLYKVFPSAKHTRFEHSIGVMHCAYKLLDATITNGIIANKSNNIADKKTFNKDKSLGIGVNLIEHLDENDLVKIFKHLRIAALLHDIGHGPLSHLFDSFAPSIKEFLAILETDVSFKSDERFSNAFYKMLSSKLSSDKPLLRIEHEDVSSYFTFKILKDLNFDEDEIYSILTILKPKLNLYTITVKVFEEEFNISQLLTDMVASAPIDCDRMDYLKRDSYFAGVSYGDYNEERILKTVLPYLKDNTIRLGLKISGLHAIESFLLARYQMFVQVYGHKTNEACNAMLDYIIGDSKNINFEQWSGIKLESSEFLELYLNLTDDSFLSHLASKFDSVNDYNSIQTINDLKQRKLWKRIYEKEEYVSHKKEDTIVQKTFNERFEILQNEFPEIKIYHGDRFPLKDYTHVGAKLLDKTAHSFYTISSTELQESSQIIKSLSQGLRIHRIYATDSNVNTAKDLARDLIHPYIVEAEKSNKILN